MCGCGKRVLARGMCKTCYERERKEERERKFREWIEEGGNQREGMRVRRGPRVAIPRGVPTYQRAHEAVRRVRGKARDHICRCGSPALQWAYLGSDNECVDDRGRRFSMSVTDYTPLCAPCHVRLDARIGDVRFGK